MVTIRQFFILLAFLNALAAPCIAQDLLVRSQAYGVEDGLPHREVNAVYQDRRGFIWIGSRGGLSRFDGYAFKNYNAATDGFLQNDIFRILEDAEGNLWLLKPGNSNDFDIWNPLTRERTTFRKEYGEWPQLSTVFHNSPRINTVDTSILIPASNGQELLKFHPRKGVSTLQVGSDGILDIVSTGGINWVIVEGSRMIGIDQTGRKSQFDLSGNQPVGRNVEMESSHGRFILNGKNFCWLADTTGILRQLPGKYVEPVLIPGASYPSIGEDLILDQFRIYRLDGRLVADLAPHR
ncbi:MAG: hypothetical protein RI973_2484, partial [Bacteroidota bacterium]